MGNLVCASRVGEIPRLGFPKSYLFEPGDQKSCAAALSIVIDEAAKPFAGLFLRQAVASRFALGEVADSYVGLYRELTKKSATSAVRLF